MDSESKELNELVGQLSPELRAEVRQFVELLLQKQKRKIAPKLLQSWAGSLSDYRDQYTSLSLQKKAIDWRSEQ